MQGRYEADKARLLVRMKQFKQKTKRTILMTRSFARTGDNFLDSVLMLRNESSSNSRSSMDSSSISNTNAGPECFSTDMDPLATHSTTTTTPMDTTATIPTSTVASRRGGRESHHGETTLGSYDEEEEEEDEEDEDAEEEEGESNPWESFCMGEEEMMSHPDTMYHPGALPNGKVGYEAYYDTRAMESHPFNGDGYAYAGGYGTEETQHAEQRVGSRYDAYADHHHHAAYASSTTNPHHEEWEYTGGWPLSYEYEHASDDGAAGSHYGYPSNATMPNTGSSHSHSHSSSNSMLDTDAQGYPIYPF
jgi:hypothetical protein